MRIRRVLIAVLLLPLLAYLIWDQIETRALARDIAAIAARGEPIAADDTPAGADTPERHDAARIYAAAVERYRALPQEHTFGLWRLDVDSAAAPPKLADLEATYRADSPPLQLVDQAAPLDFNGFGDVAQDLPSPEPLAMLSVLADLRADLLSARGKGEQAVASLVSSARVMRTVAGSYYLPLTATRLLASVRILLRHTSPSERSLADLQRAVAELPDTDTVLADVQRRRAQMIDEWSSARLTLSEAILARALRPWIARAKRAQLAAIEDSLAAAREPWPAKVAAATALERKYAPAMQAMMQRRGFLGLLALRYHGVGVAVVSVGPAGTALAAHRVTLAALAIERYRRTHRDTAPDRLDALVPAYLPAVPIDPFSGGPLVYRTDPGGYMLYSVDTNQKDDGGALYGIGSRGQLVPQQRAPRDLGIRVEVRR